MNRFRAHAVLGILGALVGVSFGAEAPLVLATRGETPRYAIRLPADAAPSCRYAAKELADYLAKQTAVSLPIRAGTTPRAAGPEIRLRTVDDAMLGADGFRLAADAQGNVEIAGGVRGILYGVYELLEEYGGIGWYASWRTVVPPRDRFEVPRDLNRTETPTFLLREPSWLDVRRATDFAVRLRMNGAGSDPQERHGGAACRFVRGLPRSHTFNVFLPTQKYFKDHPDWYAEVGGVRRGNGDNTQICLTNPEALEESVKNIAAMIAADPQGARVVGISQNDCRERCRCARCAAVDAEEESPCGSLLRFVNAIAERLEKTYPDILVETLVYQYTRKPPKITRPRANVMPCFCTYEAEFAHPMTESAYVENVALLRDLRAWGACTRNLFVWDYTSNWRNFQTPMATVFSLQPNFRLYRDCGAKYLYAEGGKYHADWANLRAWLIAKLSWNADADVPALLDRFFNGCYGPAAPEARAAFDRLHAAFRAHPDAVQTIFHRDLPHVLTDGDLDAMIACWNRALATAGSDRELGYTVRAAAYPNWATKLSRIAARTKRVWATRNPAAFPPPKDARELYDRVQSFRAEAKSRGHEIQSGDHHRTRRTLESWERIFTAQQPARANYRARVGDFELITTDSLTVDDPTALEGRAYRLAGDRQGEPLLLRMGNVAYDRNIRLRVRVHARVERAPGCRKGEALRVRAFHGFTGDAPFDRSFDVGELADGWAWYDAGSFIPEDPFELHIGGGRFARGGGGTTVRNLFVDALAFEPELPPKPLAFAEIPLSTTYANGNMWTGWAGRWTDALLNVDRTETFRPGDYYRVSTDSMMETLRQMTSYGLDGAVFNADRPALVGRVFEAESRGGLAGLFVPSLQLRKFRPGDPDRMRAVATFPRDFTNPKGWYVDGKPVFLSWWEDRFFKPDAMKRQLEEMRAHYGDFLFVTDVSGLAQYKWRAKWARGEFGQTDAEEMRAYVRDYLRAADGVYFGEYHGLDAKVDGEAILDAAYLTKGLIPRLREVFDEPEFAGKGKLLGLSCGLGHGNPYTFGNRMGQDGTRTLRASLQAALDAKPDFLVFFEWDEYNENTLIKPTLWNSYAPKRIIRARLAEARKQANEPLPGDDPATPNLILSYRKTLALGEKAVFEILNVPEAGVAGTCEVTLLLRRADGSVCASFEPQTLDRARNGEVRLEAASEAWSQESAVVPELVLRRATEATRRAFTGFAPIELVAGGTFDHKWATQPLRDLAARATCQLDVAPTDEANVWSARINCTSPDEEIDRVDLTVNGQHVFTQGGAFDDFRETPSNRVFALTLFQRAWSASGAEQPGPPTFTLTGVSQADWRIGGQTTRRTQATVIAQAGYTPDSYLRLSPADAERAILRLDWPNVAHETVHLGEILRSGARATTGTNAFTFAVSRFYGFNEYGPAATGRTLRAEARVRGDLPVSTIVAHLVTKSGKLLRSRPVSVGDAGTNRLFRLYSVTKRGAVDVQMGARRLPDLDYRLDGPNGVIVPGGGGDFKDGVLGTIPYVATHRNRGGCSFFHSCPDLWKNQPSHAPACVRCESETALSFDGTGTFFALPGTVIPRFAAYRLSFAFKPEDARREQELFASGTANLYGPVGYLRIRNGRLEGLVCGLYDNDTHVTCEEPVRAGDWNTVELVVRVDTVELVINGVTTGPRPCVMPGRYDTASWFGGRTGKFYRGLLKDIRLTY